MKNDMDLHTILSEGSNCSLETQDNSYKNEILWSMIRKYLLFSLIAINSDCLHLPPENKSVKTNKTKLTGNNSCKKILEDTRF